MATQPKTPPLNDRRAPDTRRIGQIAGQGAFLEAARWFVRERTWINDKHLQICRIPAATFFEGERAEWLRGQFEQLGWKAKLDRAGNVLAAHGESSEPSLILSAHLDTVFAPSRSDAVYYGPDGRLYGPGASDNGSGLTALLAIARILTETRDLNHLASSVLLVANVGEEGEGNLSGMRYLCRQVSQFSRLNAFIVLDGPSTDHVTSQALASRRFEVAFSGPGGHSWNDHGTPNPVHALSETVAHFIRAADERAANERFRSCSYNFGLMEGGSSINSIPASARAKLDLRSDDPSVLDELSALLTASVEHSLERANRLSRGGRLTAKIKDLGSRPGGKLPSDAPLLQTIQAVDSFLKIRSRIDCASTDANVPLSLGLPAISIGAGGQGGGAHTEQEWYQPNGREIGLGRILLVLAALAEQNIHPTNGAPAEPPAATSA